MRGAYLLTFYRSLARHRLYAALNILGLAVGIAVFLCLSLYIRFETSFERWLPDASRIYVMRTSLSPPGLPPLSGPHTFGGMLEALKGEHPQIAGTFVGETDAIVHQGAGASPERLALVGPDFLEVLNLPLQSGDPAALLRSPDEVLVSERVARRLFGGPDAVGRRLDLSFPARLGAPPSLQDGVIRAYRVTGVLKDLPRNTDLRFDLVAPMTPQMIAASPGWRNWIGLAVTTYLRLPDRAAAEALNAQLGPLVARHVPPNIRWPDASKVVIKVQAAPLTAQHLSDPKDAASVLTLAVVGVLTLALAAVNYVNLATARAGVRAKEAALRKVMGATRKALTFQFIIEALALTAIAAVVGLALAELVLPLADAATGLPLKIVYAGADSVLPTLLAVVLLVGLGAGAYPALVISRFRPAAVLASGRGHAPARADRWLREALVLFQFSVAAAFVIATAVILAQTRYLHHGDLGFERDGLAVVQSFNSPLLSEGQRSALLDVWRRTPGVVSVSETNAYPGPRSPEWYGAFAGPNGKGQGSDMDVVFVGPGFFRTYGVHLRAGRVLDPAKGMDLAVPVAAPAGLATTDMRPANMVVNLAAARAFGFSTARQALGQTIRQGAGKGGSLHRIVGVTDNLRFGSPRAQVSPTVYFLRGQGIPTAVAAIRYESRNWGALSARLQDSWRSVAPEIPFRAETVASSLQPYYQADDQRTRLFGAAAVLALGVACLGLFGLAASAAERRRHEIGIRKTLGASAADVGRLLIAQFLRPVLIANLIAWPLAYLAMRHYLAGFDQRVALRPVYFLAAAALTLAVAVLTVVAQTLRVARAEPAKTLRYD